MNSTLLKLKSFQVIVDGLLILAAFALAYFLRVGFIFSTNFPFQPYATIALITTPVTLLFMGLSRTYKINQAILSFRHFQRVVFVAIENVAVFMVLYYFAYHNFFSRLILIYIFLLTTLFVYGWHLLFRKILQLASRREVGVCRTLIIGTNRSAQEIIHQLVTVRSHIKPVAILDAHGSPHKEIHGVPVLGKMDQFERVIEQYEIDQIIQVDHLEQSLNIINFALQNDINYLMPPELLGAFQGHQRIEEWEGRPFLKIHGKKTWWGNLW